MCPRKNLFVSLAWFLLMGLLISAQDSNAKTLSIKERQNPFWEGPSTSLTFIDRQNDYKTLRTIEGQFTYGWSNGISLGALIPVVVEDSNPDPAAVKTPRLGGGRDGRAEVTANFRLWGDVLDYFAVSMGAGLPYQTDATLRNTPVDSWIVPLTAFARVDFKWLAFVPSFTDIVTFPAVLEYPTSKLYRDQTNQATNAVTVYFYPWKRWSPFISLTQALPTTQDQGTDQSQTAFIVKRVQTGFNYAASFYLDWAPDALPALLSAGTAYNFVNANPNLSRWQFFGKFRWLF